MTYAKSTFSHVLVPVYETTDMPVQDGGHSGVGEGYLSQESRGWAWLLLAACQGGGGCHAARPDSLLHSAIALQHASVTCFGHVSPV